MTTTVYNVRTGVVAVGTDVVLSDVVVMANTSSGDRVWVSDGATAAANTGIEIYRGAHPTSLGDLFGLHVRVSGRVQAVGVGSGGTVARIVNPRITQLTTTSQPTYTGSGPDLSTLTTTDAGVAYDGVMLYLNNLAVTSTSPLTLSDGTISIGMGTQLFTPTTEVGACYLKVDGIWDYDSVAQRWVILPFPGGLMPGGTCN